MALIFQMLNLCNRFRYLYIYVFFRSFCLVQFRYLLKLAFESFEALNITPPPPPTTFSDTHFTCKEWDLAENLQGVLEYQTRYFSPLSITLLLHSLYFNFVVAFWTLFQCVHADTLTYIFHRYNHCNINILIFTLSKLFRSLL